MPSPELDQLFEISTLDSLVQIPYNLNQELNCWTLGNHIMSGIPLMFLTPQTSTVNGHIQHGLESLYGRPEDPKFMECMEMKTISYANNKDNGNLSEGTTQL